MKKVLSLIISAVLTVSMLFPAFSSSVPAIGLDEASGKAGETVLLTLSVSDNPGIAGLALSLEYDTSVLQLEKAENGKLFGAFTAGKNFIWDSSADITENGVLAVFTFRISPTAEPGDCSVKPIVRSCVNSSYEDVSCALSAGTVTILPAVVVHTHTVVTDAAVPATCTEDGKTEGQHCSSCGEILVDQTVVKALGHDYRKTVTPPTEREYGYTETRCSRCGDIYSIDGYVLSTGTHTPGDVNNDGVINMKDVVLLGRYVDGESVLIAEDAAEVNADGMITIDDYKAVKRFAAGWGVKLQASSDKMNAVELERIDRFDNETTFDVDTSRYEIGDRIMLQFRFSGTNFVAAAHFHYAYDQDALKLMDQDFPLSVGYTEGNTVYRDVIRSNVPADITGGVTFATLHGDNVIFEDNMFIIEFTVLKKGLSKIRLCYNDGDLITSDLSPVETELQMELHHSNYGDVDENGLIEAADARLALRISVGLENMSFVQFENADVDQDSTVSSADARLILRASVGLEDPASLGKNKS